MGYDQGADMAIDQATQDFLSQMAEQGAKPMHEGTPEEAREMFDGIGELSGPGPEVAHVEDTILTAADGGNLLVRAFAPTGVSKSVIVYYHGGGWVIGDVDGFDNLARQLATRTQSTVVLVNYRKAPEHKYPIAVEDSWTALEWVDEHKADLATAGVPLIVVGDSAGGNLSAVMAQRAKARGGPAISLQVLVYPVTAADFDTASYLDAENQLMLNKDSMTWFWDHYAQEDRRHETEASPLQENDLSNLPPAVVLIAEHDVLRSEGEAYAAALQKAGVPVEQRLFEGQMHGFFTMVNILPGSASGIEYVSDAVNKHLSSN